MKLKIFTLVLLILLLVIQSVHAQTLNCGEGTWFHGFIGDPAFDFTELDTRVKGPDTFFAIGGSVADASVFNTALPPAQAGAVVMAFEYDTYKEPHSVVVSQLQDGTKIIGIKAFTIWGDDPDEAVRLAGIFESQDGQAMVLFKITFVFNGGDPEEVTVYRVPGYETGYGCGMVSRHISYATEFNTYFMFQPCDFSKTFVLNMDQSTSQMLFSEVKVVGVWSTQIPLGVVANENRNLYAAIVVELGVSSPFMNVHTITLPDAPDASNWLTSSCFTSLDHTTTYYDAIDNKHDLFQLPNNAEYPPLVPVAAGVSDKYIIIVQESGQSAAPCVDNCGIFFTSIKAVEGNCNDSAYSRALYHASAQGRLSVLDYKAYNSKEYITMFYDYDQSYWFAYEFSTHSLGGKFKQWRIDFTSANPDPSFNYQSFIQSFMLSTNSMTVALGSNFVLQEQTINNGAFLEMVRWNTDTSSNVLFNEPSDLEVSSFITTDTAYEWGYVTNDVSFVMTDLTNFEVDPVVLDTKWNRNPGIVVVDIQYAAITCSTSISFEVIPYSTTTTPACASTPAAQVFLLGIVTDQATGLQVSNQLVSYSVNDPTWLTIQCSCTIAAGTYDVQYIGGYEGQLIDDIVNPMIQTFSVTVAFANADTLVEPTIASSPFIYEIRETFLQTVFTIPAYTVSGGNTCTIVDTLTLTPDIGAMVDYPWITIAGRDVTIGDSTDPLLDGLTVIFTVTATDPIFGTNSALQFRVDIIAPCLTATINALTMENGPNLVVVDGFCCPTTEIFIENGVSYGLSLGYCGPIQFELVDSLYVPETGSWIALDLSSPPLTLLTAHPVSVTNELVGLHTFYIKSTMSSVNYNQSNAPTFTQYTYDVQPAPCTNDPMVAPTIPESPISYAIQETILMNYFTIAEYTTTGFDPCFVPVTSLVLTPDIGVMGDHPWLTIAGRVVTIGDSTDPLLDGLTIVFTVAATDPNFGTNADLQFQVDITAPCLTATINAFPWIDSPTFTAIDGNGIVRSYYNASDISYGGALNYCGLVQLELLDSLYVPVVGSWVFLSPNSSPRVVATPVSVTTELQGTHTFYIKRSAASANYNAIIPPTMTLVTITVEAAICDCFQVLWSDNTENSVTLQTPETSTMALATPLGDYSVNVFTQACVDGCFEDPALQFGISAITLDDLSPLPTWMTLNSAGWGSIDLTPTDSLLHSGIYTVKCEWSYTDLTGTAVTLVSGFTLITVLPCDVTSFTYPLTTLYHAQFTLGAATFTYSVPNWTQTPNCMHAETLDLSEFNGYTWITTNGRDITINPSDISVQGGVSALRLSVYTTLMDDPNYGDVTYIDLWSGSVVIEITITDPCIGVTIDQLTWYSSTDIHVPVGGENQGWFTYSLSNPDCNSNVHGPVTFRILNKNGWEVTNSLFDGPPSVLPLGSDWIIPLHPGHTFSRQKVFFLEISHPNYLAIPVLTSAFNVTICGVITAMIPPSIEWDEFADYEVEVGEAVGISIGTYSRNGDGDPYQFCLETLTFSPSLDNYPWISVNNRTVIVESSDPSLAGKSFSFSVTSTLNDFKATSDSSVTFSVSFYGEMIEQTYFISTNETETTTEPEIETISTDSLNETTTMTVKSIDTDPIGFLFDWFAGSGEYNPQAKPLIASLSSFSETGQLTIKFNKDMMIPSELQDFSQGESGEVSQMFSMDGLLDLIVVPSRDYEGDDIDRLTISSYELISYEKRTLKIQVNFLHPNYVSMNSAEKDKLRVFFKSTWFFLDIHERQILPENYILQIEMVNQLTLAQSEQLIAFEGQVEKAISAVGGLTLVTNIAMSFALKYLWKMINLFQFLVFICQWQLSYPQNALSFLQQIRYLVFLDFIPSDDITQWFSAMLGLDDEEDEECDEETCDVEENTSRVLQDAPTESLRGPKRESNFGKQSLIKNMGIMFVVALIIVVFLILLRLVKYFVMSDYRYYRAYMNVRVAIFYNLFIRYILQSALKLQIAAMTTITLISWSTVSEIAQGSFTMVLFIAITSLPIFFAIFLFWNSENVVYRQYEIKYGSMYQGIWITEASWYALSYPVVYLVRRSLFIAITFMLFDYPGIQILVFIQISVYYVMYLNTKRIMAEPSILLFENMNECTFLIVCYHFIVFTNLLDDPEIISQVGTSMMISIGIILASSTLMMLYVNLKSQLRRLKLYRLKKKQEARFKEKIETLLKLQVEAKLETVSKTLLSPQKQHMQKRKEENKQAILKYVTKPPQIKVNQVLSPDISSISYSYSEYNQSELNRIEEETIEREYPKIQHVSQTGLIGVEPNHGRARLGMDLSVRYNFTDNLSKEDENEYIPVKSTPWQYNQLAEDFKNELRLTAFSPHSRNINLNSHFVEQTLKIKDGLALNRGDSQKAQL